MPYSNYRGFKGVTPVILKLAYRSRVTDIDLTIRDTLLLQCPFEYFALQMV